jgi:hypothetical protein
MSTNTVLPTAGAGALQVGSVAQAGSKQSVSVLPVQASLFTPSWHCPASVAGQLAKAPSPHVAVEEATIADPSGGAQKPPVQSVFAVHDFQTGFPQVSMQQADQEGLAVARTARTVATTTIMHPAFMPVSFRLDART